MDRSAPRAGSTASRMRKVSALSSIPRPVINALKNAINFDDEEWRANRVLNRILRIGEWLPEEGAEWTKETIARRIAKVERFARGYGMSPEKLKNIMNVQVDGRTLNPKEFDFDITDDGNITIVAPPAGGSIRVTAEINKSCTSDASSSRSPVSIPTIPSSLQPAARAPATTNSRLRSSLTVTGTPCTGSARTAGGNSARTARVGRTARNATSAGTTTTRHRGSERRS